MPSYFGIRHLSPNGAYHIKKELDKIKPKIVLIEAPADFNEFASNFSKNGVEPPFAMLAFTEDKPIKTIVLPLAIYSPEYQAVLWCNENNVSCKFIDLPTDIILALEDELSSKLRSEENENIDNQDYDNSKNYIYSLYELFNERFGSHEAFWESNIEHSKENYFEAVSNYGKELRELRNYNNFSKNKYEYAMNYIREAYMKMNIQNEINSEILESDIVVITGSFHTSVLHLNNKEVIPMTEKEKKSLPKISTNKTLMPYSYFKMSKQAGYGAGNYAPNYYHMLWEELNKNNIGDVAVKYITTIATNMRENGFSASSAQVIDAIHLSKSLASLNNRKYPVLSDLQDACLTCFGEGELGSLINARTVAEIGTLIGKLPDGMSNTSIQEDFKSNIEDLKLNKYVSVVNTEISLDLRENIKVKSEKSAFLDLNRSFFFHRLNALNISFCGQIRHSQDTANFKEKWNLHWSTEVEIELVETSLLGDSIEKATIQVMKNSIQENSSMSNITEQILLSFLCGLQEALREFVAIFQTQTIESTDFMGFAKCMDNLATIINYGSLRKIDTYNIKEILENLYNKAILTIDSNLDCDDNQVKDMIKSIEIIDNLSVDFEFINQDNWYDILDNFTDDLYINQFISGYITALLLEKGYYSHQEIENKIVYHLSNSSECKQTANWLEGLCMKNRYQLILNLNIWKHFDDYVNSLEFEDFRRIVLFLRRAFARFSESEKNSIVDNLKELWGINIGNDVINTTIKSDELKKVSSQKNDELLKILSCLDDDFDFDNI